MQLVLILKQLNLVLKFFWGTPEVYPQPWVTHHKDSQTFNFFRTPYSTAPFDHIWPGLAPFDPVWPSTAR